MRKGLKRLSVVFSVLWLIASIFMSMYMFSELMEGRWEASNIDVLVAAHRMAAITGAIIFWLTGTAVWWALMYTGSWIARGFEKEMK